MGTRTLALTALLTLGLLAPAAPAAAADPLELEGRGFGHGIGLSQYGAQRAATQGVGWKEIVRTYYPGTSLGKIGCSVAVLISADKKLPFETVMAAMSALQSAGVKRVAFGVKSSQ